MLNLSKMNSVGEALRDAVSTHGEAIALIEADRDRENGRWTYNSFRSEIERFASLLQKHHVQPADRLAILMSNQSKWLISATAAFWSGATLVPLDYKLTPSEQGKLLAHAQPKALVVEHPIYKRLKNEIPSGVLVFVTEAPNSESGFLRWEEDATGFAYQSASRDDVACIVYSSGTGGIAKGCMLTHANYLAQGEALSKLYPMRKGEIWFSILPTNHAIDFMCGYFLPLLFGATVLHQRTLRPEFLASTMKRYGVTHMALVPMILKALKQRFEEKFQNESSFKRAILNGLIATNRALTKKRPVHSISKALLKPVHEHLGGKLRYIFAGGAFVDPEIADFFYDLGIPVVIGYGLTEAGTVLTVNDLSPYRSDTVGKAIEGTEIQIRNPNSQGMGEVWAKGPTVMKGYLNEPELTKEAIVDGWLRTGDVGMTDSSGHLMLVGRAKNMIVTEGGKNIYPEDVEIALDQVAGLQELCVFSSSFVWPSGKLSGEKLFAVVKPKTNGTDRKWLDDLKTRNRALADYKRLDGFVLWEKEFPRTASMKVKRHLLAEELKAAFPKPDAIQGLS
jgi:long-chain acyl-CoA synthetase